MSIFKLFQYITKKIKKNKKIAYFILDQLSKTMCKLKQIILGWIKCPFSPFC